MEQEAGRSKRPRPHVDPEYRKLLGVPPSTATDQSFTAQYPGIDWEPFPEDLSVSPINVFLPNQVPFPVLLAFYWDVLVPELFKGDSAFSGGSKLADLVRVVSLIEALKIAAEPLAASPLGSASEHPAQQPASPAAASQPEPQAPTLTPADEENDLSGLQVGR
jgi:hypothetical protein